MKTIREWRAAKFMGFNELVHASGVTAQTLSALEAGTGRTPRFKTMRAIADALGVDPAEVTEFAEAAQRRTEKRTQEES